MAITPLFTSSEPLVNRQSTHERAHTPQRHTSPVHRQCTASAPPSASMQRIHHSRCQALVGNQPLKSMTLICFPQEKAPRFLCRSHPTASQPEFSSSTPSMIRGETTFATVCQQHDRNTDIQTAHKLNPTIFNRLKNIITAHTPSRNHVIDRQTIADGNYRDNDQHLHATFHKLSITSSPADDHRSIGCPQDPPHPHAPRNTRIDSATTPTPPHQVRQQL